MFIVLEMHLTIFSQTVHFSSHLPLSGRNCASSAFLLNGMSQNTETKGGRPVSLTVNFKSFALK